MKRKLTGFSRLYQTALRRHLKRNRAGSPAPAIGLGRRALTIGLETLDLTRIHEQALSSVISTAESGSVRNGMVQRAGTFFAEAITPLEETHRTAHEANSNLNRMIRALNERTAALAVSNRRLKQEILQRKAVEESL